MKVVNSSNINNEDDSSSSSSSSSSSIGDNDDDDDDDDDDDKNQLYLIPILPTLAVIVIDVNPEHALKAQVPKSG